MRSAATPNRHPDQTAATWPGTCPDKPFGAGSSLVGLPQPTHVEGIAQTPMHGTSLLHTFADPAAEGASHSADPGTTWPHSTTRKSGNCRSCVLAGSTEVQGSADAGDERLLRRTPAASYPDDLRLPPDVQNIASGMIPRMGRGRDRGRGRSPGQLLAVIWSAWTGATRHPGTGPSAASGSGPNRSTTPSKASSTWNDTAAGPPRAATPGLPSGCWPWPPASGTSGQSANSPSGR